MCHRQPSVSGSNLRRPPAEPRKLGALGRRVGRPLELGVINLAHLEHRLHGAARTLRIGISNQLVQLARHDLPREPESVLEPSARARLTSVGRERIPQPVDLSLVLALDDERNLASQRTWCTPR